MSALEHDSECGTCGETWNRVETPTPAARCPFEYDHETGRTLAEQLDAYDEYLDETANEVFGIQPSRILRECDPIAYRVGFHDWLDGEQEEQADGADSRLS